MKRHRWREDGEHAERCRDCLLRRERIDPGDGRERWFWPVVWTWTPPRGDGREHREGLAALRLATGVAPAIFDFEDVIRYPIRAASRLAQVAAPLLPEGQRPDVDKMARWVAPRSPRCLDGLLEIDLIEQFGAGP